MRPHRNFRFKDKKEMFAIVGFRYDEPTSLEYDQRKEAKSISEIVLRLLEKKGADVISIRRVYLDNDALLETRAIDDHTILSVDMLPNETLEEYKARNRQKSLLGG